VSLAFSAARSRKRTKAARHAVVGQTDVRCGCSAELSRPLGEVEAKHCGAVSAAKSLQRACMDFGATGHRMPPMKQAHAPVQHHLRRLAHAVVAEIGLGSSRRRGQILEGDTSAPGRSGCCGAAAERQGSEAPHMARRPAPAQCQPNRFSTALPLPQHPPALGTPRASQRLLCDPKAAQKFPLCKYADKTLPAGERLTPFWLNRAC
jgi:hypothetical protein